MTKEDWFGRWFQVRDCCLGKELVYCSTNPFEGKEIWGRWSKHNGWTLDYTLKLVFSISDEEWCDFEYIETDYDLYKLFDKHRLRYLDDKEIMHDGIYIEWNR